MGTNLIPHVPCFIIPYSSQIGAQHDIHQHTCTVYMHVYYDSEREAGSGRGTSREEKHLSSPEQHSYQLSHQKAKYACSATDKNLATLLVHTCTCICTLHVDKKCTYTYMYMYISRIHDMHRQQMLKDMSKNGRVL